MRTKISIIIVILCITIGHSFAQDIKKVASMKQKFIALNGIDTTINKHRIMVIASDTETVIKIYPMEGILQEFVINWEKKKLSSITNKFHIGDEYNLIIFYGTMIRRKGIDTYYMPRGEGDAIVYREMKEYEKGIFGRSITELLTHMNQLP
ncbi:MAG: hypothetical protein NTX91_03135 [candidate division SR1 bacterium]|nr:hypothetical protein [candidate division SR1 bacterium]